MPSSANKETNGVVVIGAAVDKGEHGRSPPGSAGKASVGPIPIVTNVHLTFGILTLPTTVIIVRRPQSDLGKPHPTGLTGPPQSLLKPPSPPVTTSWSQLQETLMGCQVVRG